MQAAAGGDAGALLSVLAAGGTVAAEPHEASRTLLDVGNSFPKGIALHQSSYWFQTFSLHELYSEFSGNMCFSFDLDVN